MEGLESEKNPAATTGRLPYRQTEYSIRLHLRRIAAAQRQHDPVELALYHRHRALMIEGGLPV